MASWIDRAMIPVPILIVVALLILLSGVAAWVLLRTSKEELEVSLRIQAVAAGGQARAVSALPSITRRDISKTMDWRDSVAGLIGFKRSRSSQYTLKWYWVLLIGLAVGRVGVLLGSGVFGSLSWIIMPIATIGVCRSMFSSMIGKRKTKLRNQLPDAIGLIVRAVRVGVPVTEALRAVAKECPEPTSLEFGQLSAELLIGAPLDKALRQMAERNDLPEYGFFAAALSLQAQTGGGLAETLELLADVARKRVAMQARGYALSSEARTSTYILGALPFVSGGSVYLVNPDYIGLLFIDPTGQMILGLALLSLCIGVFVMRMIIRSALTA